MTLRWVREAILAAARYFLTGILALRFSGNLSQSEIAQQVGLSQMHVSRLLRQSLEFLRRRLSE